MIITKMIETTQMMAHSRQFCAPTCLLSVPRQDSVFLCHTPRLVKRIGGCHGETECPVGSKRRTPDSRASEHRASNWTHQASPLRTDQSAVVRLQPSCIEHPELSPERAASDRERDLPPHLARERGRSLPELVRLLPAHASSLASANTCRMLHASTPTQPPKHLPNTDALVCSPCFQQRNASHRIPPSSARLSLVSSPLPSRPSGSCPRTSVVRGCASSRPRIPPHHVDPLSAPSASSPNPHLRTLKHSSQP